MIKNYTLFCESLKSDMWSIIPHSVKELHKIFNKAGKKLYVVGGAVRDFLTGDKPKDFDLATDALPDEVIKILQSSNYDFNLQGKAFGVVVVYTEDDPQGMEIATFREDISKGRNPEVKLGVTIEDDVKRRDLTYNALFYDLEKREIIDLVGGISDMENKLTRMVGDPLERIDEDSLRILRAFRFASRYKTPLSEDLTKAISQRNQLQNLDPETSEMKRISPERIWEEIKKAFKQAKSLKHYLDFFTQFNMWGEVFPGSKINKDIVECDELTSYLANIFKLENTSILEKKLVQDYKIDSDVASKVVFLIDLLKLTPENAFDLYKRKVRCHVSNSQIIDWLDTCNIHTQIFIRFIDYKPTVSAEDLMSKGFKGRELGEEIKRLEVENFKNLLKK
jgi:tRNA nucleotidyltransferase/poly(A) polymerase